MNDKKKPTSDFGADSSAAAAIARAKSKRVPVGGVPMPAMPRLDQPPPDSHRGVQGVRAQRVLTPAEKDKLIAEGKYVPGIGADYAANQPMFRNPTDSDGNEQSIDPRLVPRPPGSGLRPETVQQLEVLAAANSSDDKELSEINKEIDAIDEVYEDDELGNRVKSLLENKKRKEAIESRCMPMEFSDLLVNGFVQQKVPIIPGKFEPTFSSMRGEENIEILRLIGEIKGGNEQHLLDTMSLYRLTVNLHAINGRLLSSHLDQNGDFDKKMFFLKYKVICKMALSVLADLDANNRWFARRVQKLTVVDDIKGF